MFRESEFSWNHSDIWWKVVLRSSWSLCGSRPVIIMFVSLVNSIGVAFWWCLMHVLTSNQANVLVSLVNIYTSWLNVMNRRQIRHECTNMGNVKRLELWWQLYGASLPERDVRNFRPLDFCWTECTYNVTFRHVHIMTVAVWTQQVLNSVCVCIVALVIRHGHHIASALYCYLCPLRYYHIFSHHQINSITTWNVFDFLYKFCQKHFLFFKEFSEIS